MRKSTLNRMLELADIKPVIKESKMSLSNFELVKESVNGNTYAIVIENKKYFIKLTQTKDKLTESDFDYVGGMANKNKKSFTSFEKATRHLNLMFEEINNHYDVENINILESDRLDEKKFILKMKKKKFTPVEEPASEEGGGEFDFGAEEESTGKEEFDFGAEEEAGGDEEFDFGAEEESTGEEEFDFDAGEEEGSVEEFGGDEDDLELDDSEDEIKDIQSTTGKLGQQLRDTEDLSSDMQKWVAKSVLSALDLDNMESEDKKDIIRTIKKKSDDETEEVSSTEEFDFDENDVEESYESYMGDKKEYDDYDNENLPITDVEMPIKDKGYLNIDYKNVDNPYEEEFPSYDSVYNPKNEYESYMTEKDGKDIDEWLHRMENIGMVKPMAYDSYMDEDVNIDVSDYNPETGGLTEPYESKNKNYDEDDNPNTPKDEDKLLLDDIIDNDQNDIPNAEAEALYGPNSTKRYDRSKTAKARRQADKDITTHYYKPAAPGYEIDPVEKWGKHKLPYNTEYFDENVKNKKTLKEGRFTDRMETYEQEKAYEDMETLVKRYGLDIGWCHKETTEDPEESIIYLDIKNGSNKLLKIRINSVGDIEVGEMKGKNFIGEPLDSVEDFHEILDEDLTKKEKEEMEEMEESIEMSPQPQRVPQRAPEKEPSKPQVDPGVPQKEPPTERPSRKPFTPPPSIDPNDPDALPGPKAGDDGVEDDKDVEFEY